MGIFSMLNKNNEELVGGISKRDLDNIKKRYVPNQEYTRKFLDYKARNVITKDNIMENLRNGLDFNYRVWDDDPPLYLLSKTRDVYEVMVYFGANPDFKEVYRMKGFQLNAIPQFLLEENNEFIQTLSIDVFDFFYGFEKLKWLKGLGVDFSKLAYFDIDRINSFTSIRTWLALTDMNDPESLKFILNETSFDFNSEIEYTGFGGTKILAKIWFIYVMKYLNNRYLGNDLKSVKIRGNLFKQLYKFYDNRFLITDTNSLGQNIFFMLSDIEKNKHSFVNVFIDFGVNPFQRDNSGTSFYDLLRENQNENKKSIELIEKSKFYSEYQNDLKKIKKADENLAVVKNDASNEVAKIVCRKNVVVTGSIDGYTRKEYENYLSDFGANILAEVSGKTEVLIVGKNPGSKLTKAQKLDVEIVYLSNYSDDSLVMHEPSLDEKHLNKENSILNQEKMQLDLEVINFIFDQYNVFDEVDCYQDIRDLFKLKQEDLLDGFHKLLESIKPGLTDQTVHNIKKDIEDYINGTLVITKTSSKEESILLESSLKFEAKPVTKRIPCQPIQFLDNKQKEVISLISKGEQSKALDIMIGDFDWAFSIDRNVNLLHISIMFDCIEIATYLINQGIDTKQPTTEELVGVPIFNLRITENLTALDIAKSMGKSSIEGLIKQSL